MTFTLAGFLADNHIEDKKIAVGVSGGSDSLALVMAAHEELTPLGWKLAALTVDHRLRPESAQEAEYVARTLKAAGIEHHILVWDEPKPQTGIEEAARKARYGLMGRWCHDNGYHQIMLAHHQEDQVETFFIRLQRGSGLDGLCGMRPVDSHDGLLILRPLLDTPKAEMKKYLQNRNINWVEDQSNYSDAFLRCRIRKVLEHTGISRSKIADTIKLLQKTERYLKLLTLNTLTDNFRFLTDKGCFCQRLLWETLDPEMQFRLLGLIFRRISKLDYIPRASRILSLINRLSRPDFKSATLGECEIQISDNKLWIFKECTDADGYTRAGWEKYLKTHPELQKLKIPYKMRVLLVKNQ